MNSNKNLFRKLTTAKLLGAALALTTLFAAANLHATPTYKGKFSLPYEVRWGGATIPAGEYFLRVDYVAAVTLVTIQEAKSNKTIAILRVPSLEGSNNKQEGSALLIAGRGRQRIVHSLRLAELGEVFIYEPALAHGRGAIEEVRSQQAVPVIAAKK